MPGVVVQLLESLRDRRSDLAPERSQHGGIALGGHVERTDEVRVDRCTQFVEPPPLLVFRGDEGGAADTAASAVPISPGQLAITSDVTIVFVIE